jgi:hypothetical protein
VCGTWLAMVAIAIPLHCYFIAALDVDVIYHLYAYLTQPMRITSAAFAPYPHECPWVGQLGSLDISSKSATSRDRA